MGKVKEFLEEKMKSELIRKIYKTGSPEWIVLKMIKPSEITKKNLNLPDDFKYWVIFNTKAKKFKCDCMGYLVHKHCKHVKYFESFINQLNENGNN